MPTPPLCFSNIPKDHREARLGAKDIESTFTPKNDHHQTRLPYDSNMSVSSPDLSLASPSILINLSLQTFLKLGSDLLVLLITLPIAENIPFAPPQNFYQFTKGTHKKLYQ